LCCYALVRVRLHYLAANSLTFTGSRITIENINADKDEINYEFIIQCILFMNAEKGSVITMISSRHLNAIRLIYERLKDKTVNWVFTGSVAFALQGLDVDVHDVDLQTDKIGVYEIECFFKEFVVQPVQLLTSKRIQSHFGVLELSWIRVEIMGDIQKRREDSTWESPVNLTQHKKLIKIGEMMLPVFSLEYECQAYFKMGRIEKAEMLREWLQVKSDEALCIGLNVHIRGEGTSGSGFSELGDRTNESSRN